MCTCASIDLCANVCVWVSTLRHASFSRQTNMKMHDNSCMTALSSSIHQSTLQHIHTQTHTSWECRVMLMGCHVIYCPIYDKKREKMWEIGRGVKNWTRHVKKTCPTKAFFSLSLFIWSALDVCRMSHRILLHLGGQMGTRSHYLDRWMEMVEE